MTWYVVRSVVKGEAKAEGSLRKAGFRTYAPWQRFEKFNKRKKTFVRHERRIVPRYLFVEITVPREQIPWGFIRELDGVDRVVGTLGRPIYLNKSETKALEEIMRAEADFAFDETRVGKLHRREIGKTKKETTKLRYPVGSKVLVKDGPFASFAGEVVNVNGRGHVEVLVSLFGRLSTVEMEAGQVEGIADTREAA